MTIYRTGVRVKIDLGYKIGSPQDKNMEIQMKGIYFYGNDDTYKVAYFLLSISWNNTCSILIC